MVWYATQPPPKRVKVPTILQSKQQGQMVRSQLSFQQSPAQGQTGDLVPTFPCAAPSADLD